MASRVGRAVLNVVYLTLLQYTNMLEVLCPSIELDTALF